MITFGVLHFTLLISSVSTVVFTNEPGFHEEVCNSLNAYSCRDKNIYAFCHFIYMRPHFWSNTSLSFPIPILPIIAIKIMDIRNLFFIVWTWAMGNVGQCTNSSMGWKDKQYSKFQTTFRNIKITWWLWRSYTFSPSADICYCTIPPGGGVLGSNFRSFILLIMEQYIQYVVKICCSFIINY